MNIKEIERLIKQYENPEDMTLMYMWCDEKAKDEIKRLNNIIDKAIEYILNNKLYCFKYDDEELFEITTDKKAKDELLKILDKGSDK